MGWSAPASNGGGTVTGFVVTPYRNGIPQAPITFTSTPRVQAITGLTNGASYRLRVAAINAAGTGTQSSLSAAATPRP